MSSIASKSAPTSILSDKPPLPPIPASAPPQAIVLNKDVENKENRDDSNSTTTPGTPSFKAREVGPRPKDEARRSCNRCQNCPGFSSHEWRNTCTTCRCPRSCHDVSIGARCCGFHRAGFDPTTTTVGPPSNVTSPCSSSSSSSQHPPTAQPPPQTNVSSPSSTSSAAGPQTCSRNAAAESSGYAWIPTVSIIRMSGSNPKLTKFIPFFPGFALLQS